jgi:hypothetical protein
VNGTCELLTGTPCDDGDACSQADVCQAGLCASGAPVTCAPSGECHEAGTCDPASGACSEVLKSDGAPCEGGTCEAGECFPTPTTGSGGAGGAGGAGGSGGAGGGEARPFYGDITVQGGVCWCGAAGRTTEEDQALWPLSAALLLLGIGRRQRRGHIASPN